MKIIPLSEGSFTVDKSKRFIPFDREKDDLHTRADGSLLVEIQPFLIITKRDVLLLDTGLGFHDDGIMQLHRHIMAAGIKPPDITKILISHLHKDHAGGIRNKVSSKPSFPNALYYINRKEWDFASADKTSSYDSSLFSLLTSSAQLILLEDKGNIDGYIDYEWSGGHSPYHTVFIINEENEKIFYGGDVAPQLQQMKSRFIAKYDFDGRKSMHLRSAWWEKGKQEHWTFLFYHDIKTPFIKL